MNMTEKTIILGDEYDENLRNTINLVLKNNNAVSLGKSWGVGGSQEIEEIKMKLGNEIITIEAETFIGITIKGTSSVVENIAQQVRNQLPIKN